jgi:hypothetical protein
MRTFASSALLALLVAACGGSKKQAAEPAPAPAAAPAATPAPSGQAEPAGGGTSCDKVADHLIEIALASDDFKNAKPEAQQAMKEKLPQLRETTITDCKNAPYPEDVKSCLMKAKGLEDLNGCSGEGQQQPPQ